MSFFSEAMVVTKKEPLHQVVRAKMAMLIHLLFFAIKLIAQHIFRIKTEDVASKSDTQCLLETVPEAIESEEEEEYRSNFSFKFEHQIPELNKSEEETPMKSTSISNCQFSSEKNFSGFVAAVEPVSYSIHESFVNSEEENTDCTELKFLSEKENTESEFFISSVEESFMRRRSNKFLSSKGFEKSFKELRDVMLSKKEPFIMEPEEPVAIETKSWGEKEVSQGFSGFDSDSDSMSSSDGYSVKNLAVDCDSDGFLSEKDFGEGESLMDSNGFEVELLKNDFEEGQSSCSNNELSDAKSPTNNSNIITQLDDIWFDHDSSELELELKELNSGEEEEEEEESPVPSSSSILIEFMDSSDDELAETDLESTNGRLLSSSIENKEPEVELKKSKDSDAEDLDELESLWEHQELIEQLKMELKKARAVGLPTILEESESPREIEDLKPWKINEKFLHEDPMDELHKFYQSYRERMRKFDILNYQKMYAIGFLQLKVPLESLGTKKPLFPTLLSHLSQNLRPLHRRKSSTKASEAFIKELQADLETVYVGQTCLSWEFLRWQYEKARELPESDPYRNHQYNQVAGEFQQFQVIVRRFIENEPFQGPRLPNYVKNRCILRNLLQVPVIKEDCLKDKMEERKKVNDVITSVMLEDIMGESINIFWEFIQADKDENSTIMKTLIRNQVELEDPSDQKLMADIQATLQKKDKKLKDILKTGNCIVKKFKKPREDRSNQDLFFSQVDVKLVSRVLKMSRVTTDQLVWCHTKLEKILIAERKVYREPAFLLFPC